MDKQEVFLVMRASDVQDGFVVDSVWLTEKEAESRQDTLDDRKVHCWLDSYLVGFFRD